MKNFVLLILPLAISVVVCSCTISYTERIEPLGYGPPMELSQKKVHFHGNGGDVTIHCLNHSTWEIAVITECGLYGAEDIEHPIEFSGDHAHQEAVIDGIRVLVDDDNPNDKMTSVRIIVEPSTTHRSWRLFMSDFNTFATIHISQN